MSVGGGGREEAARWLEISERLLSAWDLIGCNVLRSTRRRRIRSSAVARPIRSSRSLTSSSPPGSASTTMWTGMLCCNLILPRPLTGSPPLSSASTAGLRSFSGLIATTSMGHPLPPSSCQTPGRPLGSQQKSPFPLRTRHRRCGRCSHCCSGPANTASPSSSCFDDLGGVPVLLPSAPVWQRIQRQEPPVP
ncbi:hypothetical protein ZIOFF_017625 [Zingiber officinale]|uniref:Uncharacterized protein n=1 Tax=Zingiber officinale TaxID=94328 RepID=A0A8J5HF99_ZINOF|nr:hypothetical protein ZIOFF_017625 [Zingiber officinale]